MTTENNLEIFLGGFAKVFNEQWQVDVRLKAGDSNENAAISAHKLVLVFYFFFSCHLFIILQLK